MMDAYVTIVMAYYVYAGLTIILCLLAYFWIPKGITMLFDSKEDTEEE